MLDEIATKNYWETLLKQYCFRDNFISYGDIFLDQKGVKTGLSLQILFNSEFMIIAK